MYPVQTISYVPQPSGTIISFSRPLRNKKGKMVHRLKRYVQLVSPPEKKK